MLKKYLPLIALIACALLFFWIKKNQRGTSLRLPGKATTIAPEPFKRDGNNIEYSKHARCRMDCRNIDDTEVKEILKEGSINFSKIGEDSRGKTYPLEGVTHDKQHVRIVFAAHEDKLVVVTVVDLDKEWPCECN